MDGTGQRIDIQKLLLFGEDLVDVLRNQKDGDLLLQATGGAKSLRAFCEEESREVHESLEEYDKRIDACQKNISNTNNEAISDEELENLQKELAEQLQHEELLHAELRELSTLYTDLQFKRVIGEEQKAELRRKEKEALKLQDTLSMCASVTTIIPNSDDRTKISGYFVDRDKKKITKFEFEQSSSLVEICNRLWEKDVIT